MFNIDNYIHVFPNRQKLALYRDGRVLNEYAISTAKNGLGEYKNSYKTPRGWHQVIEKIGNNDPIGTVFSSRIKTGEIYNQELSNKFPNRDWILTRIIRLKGLEPGLNSGGEVDSFERYIYIHGTHEEDKLGMPASKGCIRMGNRDIIELFDSIYCNIKVFIDEKN